MEQGLLHGRLRRPLGFGAGASGRDRVQVFEPRMRSAALARLQTEGELERALDRDELEGMGCPLSQGYLFSRPLRAADDRALVLQDLRR